MSGTSTDRARRRLQEQIERLMDDLASFFEPSSLHRFADRRSTSRQNSGDGTPVGERRGASKGWLVEEPRRARAGRGDLQQPRGGSGACGI